MCLGEKVCDDKHSLSLSFPHFHKLTGDSSEATPWSFQDLANRTSLTKKVAGVGSFMGCIGEAQHCCLNQVKYQYKL